jgi:hypothetical protein
MATLEIVKINDRFIEAWNLHNAVKLLNLCDDNIIYKINNGLEIYKGKNEVFSYFNNWITAFPDLSYKVFDWIAADNMMAVEYEFTGTHTGILRLSPSMHELKPTYWKVTTCGCYNLKLKNDNITEVSKYPDQFSLFNQLGLFNEIHPLIL